MSTANQVSLCDFVFAGISLQEWVEIQSRELQMKEKKKGTNKGQATGTAGGLEGREAAELRGEQQEATGDAAEEGEVKVEEVSEVEVPLVRKRSRLMKAGNIRSAGEQVSAKEAMSTRDAAE